MYYDRDFILSTAGSLEAVYAHLVQAMDDVEFGRTQALDEAFDDILGELDEVLQC